MFGYDTKIVMNAVLESMDNIDSHCRVINKLCKSSETDGLNEKETSYLMYTINRISAIADTVSYFFKEPAE